jgi:N-acetylmuramoyl-L-alanine amidase
MKKIGWLSILLSVYSLLIGSGKDIIHLKNIRYYSGVDYTRVVLDLSAPLQVKEKVLPGEEIDRLYFDLEPCDFAREFPGEKKKEIPVKTGYLQQIRLARNKNNSVRVVFDFNKIGKYTLFYLSSPFRVVFDIFREEVKAAPGPAGAGALQPVDSSYSIVRQLGLGVRTIVIDPGHGGKDPGAENKSLHLSEKEITLDIAGKLKDLFQKTPGLTVILTRQQDQTMTLEERTAIANSNKADLFISIHVNSAPRKSAQGIETYYLNITGDPWAMEVAALENKVNGKSIGEMSDIVEQIVKHAQISESKIFTQYIQANLVNRLQRKYKNIQDLGVKQAPFFVLAGAGMPASLAEVSFLSNAEEAKCLRLPAYRGAIAEGLYSGILEYIKTLGGK